MPVPAQVLVSEAAPALAKLAATQPSSARLVYMDPPYRTGHTFHHYDDSLTQDDWTSMMRDVIEPSRDLLTDDGSMWVHLDDSAQHVGRVLLDDVYGPGAFVATIVWQKRTSRENRAAFSASCDYIHVYAKNPAVFKKSRNLLPRTADSRGRYSNPDSDFRGPWQSTSLTAQAGPGRRSEQFYTVAGPHGVQVTPPIGSCWRYTHERFVQLDRDGRIAWGRTGMPRLKRFLAETADGLVPSTLWLADEVGTTDEAKRELVRLFPSAVPFDTPKPTRLMARILHIATGAGDLVIDPFAGSGTTAAVAQDMDRRCITIEREQTTVDRFVLPRLRLRDEQQLPRSTA